MLEIKGAAARSIPEFVRQRFGEDAFNEWLGSLPAASAELMMGNIMASSWYPVEDAFVVPTAEIVEKFFGGNIEGAWELGRFNADLALKGVYKIFVRIGSPKWVLSRSSSLMTAFYRPARCETVGFGNNQGRLCIYDFADKSGLLEHRIGGFIQRAVEISGASKVEVVIEKSIAAGSDFIEYIASWE
ncbi:MAG: hypothetical protein GY854_00830 [Deltaproteobacteria bacterium]|nr:hypothetical protein [Deltaproteobacteria bacterium]